MRKVLFVALTSAIMCGIEPVNAVPSDDGRESGFLAYAVPGGQVAKAAGTAPLGLKCLGFKKIFEIRRITTANGEQGSIIYCGQKEWDNAPNTNHVQYVFYIPEKHNLPTDAVYFPTVKNIIYHNLGGDNDFAGLEVCYPVYVKGKKQCYLTREIKLKDDDINDLIYLISGKKPYENNIWPEIRILETDKAALLVPKTSE